MDGLLAREGGAVRQVPLRQQEEDRFRSALTAYADSVPGHTVESLGQAITITGVEEFSLYEVRLDSLYETRGLERRVKPFGGEEVPAAPIREAEIDPWGYDNPPPEAFAGSTIEHPVTPSRSVRGCDRCSGQGKWRCDACQGAGRWPDPACGGRGRVPCELCGGTRRIRKMTGTQAVPHKCSGCNGTGVFWGEPCKQCHGHRTILSEESVYEWDTCYCDDGQQTCGACGGTGLVACQRCSGTGAVTCGDCQGAGRLLDYLAVVRTFRPASASATAQPGGVPRPVGDRLREGAEPDVILDLHTTQVPREVHLMAGNPELRDAVARVFTESARACKGGRRVARQRLVVGMLPALRISYRYGGKPYSAWWLDLPGRPGVIPVTSPLADVVQEKVEEALGLWEEGSRRGAALALQDAIDMGKRDARCRKTLDGLRERIPPELWGLAGRVFSPTKFAGRAARALRRNPFLLGVVAVAAVLLLLAVGVPALVYLTGFGTNRPSREQVREARALLRLDDNEPIRAADLARGMKALYYSGSLEKDYGGKTVLVTGTVSDTSGDTVFLEAGGEFATMDCRFGASEEDRVKGLKRGQQVTLRGTIRVYRTAMEGEAFTLEDCRLVQAEPPR